MYYPRTSEDGEDFGRDLDGFVMAAFKDGGNKDLEATIDADGVTIAAAGDDTLIPDLNHCLCPGG